jgi:arylformamidase
LDLIDISPLLKPETAVFPGDTPLSREVLLDLSQGDNLTLSTLRSTVHLGSHLDAPSHYDVDGATIESVDLSRCIGECQVISVTATDGEEITLEHLVAQPKSSRVLLNTGSHPDPDHWGGNFSAISPSLIRYFAENGVTLLGVDTPSVDHADSKDLLSHAACKDGDILILEGLVLNGVEDGAYELLALPLKLQGFDASPVRAVLRSLPL